MIRGAVLFVLAAILLAFVGSVCISKVYWGYWPGPPRLDSRVVRARAVTAMGDLDWPPPTLPPATNWFASMRSTSDADPTEYPLAYTIHQWKAAGLPVRAFGRPRTASCQLAKLPLDPRVRAKDQHGYNSGSVFRGFWADMRGADGKDYLFVAGDGGQVSNDHHPHYRLLYRRNGSSLTLVNHQVFYFDVAGMERAVWYRVFLALSIVLTAAALVLLTIAGAVAGARARRSRPSPV